jgi:ribosomal protein S24E
MANYKKWSDAEKSFIKDNISTYSDNELAAKLSQMTGENISTAMIRRQRRKFGVVKPRGRKKKNIDIANT